MCVGARNRNLALFELLGGWVSSTPDGERQRLYAEACHRHAWHAELWAMRAPSIPAAQADAGPSALHAADDEPSRRELYGEALRDLRGEIAALRRRIDATLDPSTARTIELVDSDLTRLQARAESTPT